MSDLGDFIGGDDSPRFSCQGDTVTIKIIYTIPGSLAWDLDIEVTTCSGIRVYYTLIGSHALKDKFAAVLRGKSLPDLTSEELDFIGLKYDPITSDFYVDNLQNINSTVANGQIRIPWHLFKGPLARALVIGDTIP